jgi:chorismate mutase/prephenate dehydratase
MSKDEQLKITCIGPAASFSHIAAKKVFGDIIREDDFMPQDKSCNALKNQTYDYAVIPIENNVGGFVDLSLDALNNYTNYIPHITILGQIHLPVIYYLISNDTIKNVDTIYSHYQAFIQCRKKLAELEKEWGKSFKKIEVSSTSYGAYIAKDTLKSAALASKEASKLYEVSILKKDLQDNINNTTRFYIIQFDKPPLLPTDKYRSAFLFKVDNQPGTLTRVLNLFAKNNINLLSIATRPLQPAPDYDWNYTFFLECEGHIKDEPLASIYGDLEEKSQNLRNLGSFPARWNRNFLRFIPYKIGASVSI